MALTATTQAYVRTRCKYCGSKLYEEYGLMWCSKPCSMGAKEKKLYEMQHHLGPYAPEEPEEPEEPTGD